MFIIFLYSSQTFFYNKMKMNISTTSFRTWCCIHSNSLKGQCSSWTLDFLKFFFSQHWLGTYERPSNPPRSSFYIVSEASYGRFSVPFLSRIYLDQNKWFFGSTTSLETLRSTKFFLWSTRHCRIQTYFVQYTAISI